jgi:hypothetical protein
LLDFDRDKSFFAHDGIIVWPKQEWSSPGFGETSPTRAPVSSCFHQNAEAQQPLNRTRTIVSNTSTMRWFLNWYMLYGALLFRNVVHCNLIDERHPPPAFGTKKRNRSFESGESGLRVTPCQPEDDGYFGGTFGESAVLRYTFEMESTTGADIVSALDEVSKQVSEAILVNTFPQLCGGSTHGRLVQLSMSDDTRINGFHLERGQINFKGTLSRMGCIFFI